MGYENWKTLDFLSWAANNAPNKEELVLMIDGEKLEENMEDITLLSMVLVLLMAVSLGKAVE